MKTSYIKLRFASAGLLLLLMMPSCKKYLLYNSQSTISQSVAFTSVSYTNSAVIGVYNLLNGDNGLTKEATIWSLTTDEFKTSGSYGDDRRGVSMYGPTKDNSEIYSAFINLYTGIERANIAIKGIQTSTLYAGGAAGNPQMGTYLGEVMALRSLYYFVLVRNWGSVVAQWVPSSDEPALDVPVTQGKDVLDHLIADLKTAEDLVPWRSDAGYPDTRFTKGAVKALRARIALFRGGYMMDKPTHTMTRYSDYLTDYKIAYQECADLMARRDQHDLNPVYENIFKTLHSATRLDPTNELMFEIGAYGGSGSTDDKLGYYNGLRFNASSPYGASSGGILCIPTYFYEFDPVADSRRDVTINAFQIDANGNKIMNTLTNMTDGKFRKSWLATAGGTNQYLGVHWPVMRFADVLLMFAEADNEINQSPSAAAQSALMEIRKRAYAGYASAIPVIPTDYAGFFQAIVKERLLEFGGEAVRKYDLMRWNLMGSKFDETRTKLRALMNGTAPYNNMPLYVYNRAAAYAVTNSQQELSTVDNYGGAPNATLFQPGLGSSTAPTGYTAYKWRADISEAGITGTSTGFATFFLSNKSEVFPFSTTLLLQNTQIVQNYGY